MDTILSFDDVLLRPRMSQVKSRQDVDTSTSIAGYRIKLPIISSNMDSVTGPEMARAMNKSGGVGCLHRFWSIEDNVGAFTQSEVKPWVSVGLGKKEIERAEALYSVGARTVVVDVAHGASMAVVEQAALLTNMLRDCEIIVGNFADAEGIADFVDHLGGARIAAFKVGIGGGSACLTRVVTGCGLPTFGSVLDCARTGHKIIADGGIRNSGDVCKALAAGASAVMLGKMLAGTDESPAEAVYERRFHEDRWGQAMQMNVLVGKRYRGSASAESYEVQGKTAAWRSPEGDSFMVPYVGPVAKVLEQIDGGIRSCMSYMNASTLGELRDNADFVRITSAGNQESAAHGKSS